MNCMQIDKASISNGLGVRVVLWCAGCTRKCKGCFNPETWSFNAGKKFDETAKEYLFKQLSKPYIKGVTFSGGHPLEPENIDDIQTLINEIKAEFPNKDIWIYTGLTLDVDDFTTKNDNDMHNKIQDVLSCCDVVVDGPFIESERTYSIAFRGSKNQRIIDVEKTIEQNKIINLI